MVRLRLTDEMVGVFFWEGMPCQALASPQVNRSLFRQGTPSQALVSPQDA
jgi:hypothetical protein